MDKHVSINKNEIHLWRIALQDFITEESSLMTLLSADEVERAHRFKFDIHRQRFVAARANLRRVLSAYTQVVPQDISFIYGAQGKPFLQNNPLQLQFNVSHSDDMAVIAVTIESEIGVDIEKIEPGFKEGVASRFFSVDENTELKLLSGDAQVAAFYRIWSKKEALIKALGEGLFAPLDKFTVSASLLNETISIVHEDTVVPYYIESFFVHVDYAAAFATRCLSPRICEFRI